jgi:hypothetical protein
MNAIASIMVETLYGYNMALSGVSAAQSPRIRCPASVAAEPAEPVSGLAGTGAGPTLAPAT